MDLGMSLGRCCRADPQCPHAGCCWHYLFSFVTFLPLGTGLSWRALKSQRRKKSLFENAVPKILFPCSHHAQEESLR